MTTQDHVLETDILIVGGSVAGGFAAIKAKEADPSVDILIVDKGYASKAGGGGIAGGWWIAWDPKWGRTFEDTKQFALDIGEYINNQDWLDVQIRESYDRFKDLASWGAPYHQYEDGEPILWPYGPVLTNLRFNSREYLPPMRKKAESLGIKFMDRIYVTELIMQDGKCQGALGFSTNTGDFYILKAKAVILCAGCSGFKTPGFMGDFRAGDSEGAAYRAGAEMISREFGGKEGTAAREYPNTFVTTGTIIAKHYINSEGRDFMPDYLSHDSKYGGWQSEVQTRNSWLFEVAAGRGPIYWNIDASTPEELEKLKVHKTLLPRAYIADQLGINITSGKTDIIGGTAAGEDGRGKGGIRINLKCETSIPGLYAAGDNAGSMSSGSSYVSAGWAFPHAAVTGAHAGENAVEYVKGKVIPEIDMDVIEEQKKVIYMPLERKSGYSPEWVLERLQSYMAPYYILQVKEASRLEGTLMLMKYMKEHLVPMLFVHDPHELRMANEIRNMVINAEMNLRASLFRTESRGGHYREDYPFRDDPNWLAWVTIKKDEDGEMVLSKEQLPEEWWPDLSIPYTERYEYRIPAEVIK